MPAAECPFPGMDPFLEGPRWRDFHNALISDIRDDLVAQLPDRYVAVTEERVVLTDPDGGEAGFFGDAAVRDRRAGVPEGGGTAGAEAPALTAGDAMIFTTPYEESLGEAYLEVREAESRRLVAVLELLSPTNKRLPDRAAYLRKRDALFRTDAHVVEVDLLRGGRRLPTTRPLPARDDFTFVSHATERPQVRVRAWDMAEPIPPFPVPLNSDDGQVRVDLGRLVRERHARAGYRWTLNYDRTLEPALPPADAAWVAERLAAAGLP